MTHPEHNSPDQAAQAAPATRGKALQMVRLGIALALIVGVGVFGVFAINELSKPFAPPKKSQTFGASDTLPGETGKRRTLPGDVELAPDNPLNAYIRSNNRIAIKHHPGKFQPFRNSASFDQLPYRQPIIDGEVWEFCAYIVPDALPMQAIEHYAKQAEAKGMALITMEPSSDQTPGGTFAVWRDRDTRLEVTAWPKPVEPPLRPKLNWVVKYSYPAPKEYADR